ncbi:MAG TPA: hypothetical protein ENJ18_10255 [Nannocystis exedens]|nr:hypothetical protein [Nannocystis exedens]
MGNIDGDLIFRIFGQNHENRGIYSIEFEKLIVGIKAATGRTIDEGGLFDGFGGSVFSAAGAGIWRNQEGLGFEILVVHKVFVGDKGSLAEVREVLDWLGKGADQALADIRLDHGGAVAVAPVDNAFIEFLFFFL